MIAGYIVPDAGTIHVNGRLMSAPGSVVPPDQRGMGMVFQNYAVWPHKTVYENVVFGLKVRKTPAASAKQKVARRARAGQPDRPRAALSERAVRRPAAARGARPQPRGRAGNPPARRAALQSRRQAARADARRAQARCSAAPASPSSMSPTTRPRRWRCPTTIAVIHGGRLQQFGTPQEVYARPANRVVADFMGLVNLLPAKVAGRRHDRSRPAD